MFIQPMFTQPVSIHAKWRINNDHVNLSVHSVIVNLGGVYDWPMASQGLRRKKSKIGIDVSPWKMVCPPGKKQHCLHKLFLGKDLR